MAPLWFRGVKRGSPIPPRRGERGSAASLPGRRGTNLPGKTSKIPRFAPGGPTRPGSRIEKAASGGGSPGAPLFAPTWVDGTVEEPVLFTIDCLTCRRRLAVRSEAAIGAILNCPKCGSMVPVIPPEGWIPPGRPPAEVASATTGAAPADALSEPAATSPPSGPAPSGKPVRPRRQSLPRAVPIAAAQRPANQPPPLPVSGPDPQTLLPALPAGPTDASAVRASPAPHSRWAAVRGSKWLLWGVLPVVVLGLAVATWAIVASSMGGG